MVNINLSCNRPSLIFNPYIYVHLRLILPSPYQSYMGLDQTDLLTGLIHMQQLQEFKWRIAKTATILHK